MLVGEPSDIDEALLVDEELPPIKALRPSARPPSLHPAHAACACSSPAVSGMDPARVRYETGDHGKPRLLPGLPPLEFNLSHSEGLALIAATRDRSVGVDIERIRDMPDAGHRPDVLFVGGKRGPSISCHWPTGGCVLYCWTRKEAVIKASGEGLAVTSTVSTLTSRQARCRH